MNVGTAPLTFQAVKGLKEGHAVFTMPKGVIKCPGAGQKVRQLGILHQYNVTEALLGCCTAAASTPAATRLVAAAAARLVFEHVPVAAAAARLVFEHVPVLCLPTYCTA
jgi:hypothetical protein